MGQPGVGRLGRNLTLAIESFLGTVTKSGADYRAAFPDVPECQASGPSVVDAIINGQRALAEHIDRLIRDKKSPPRPMVDTIDANEDVLARFLANVEMPGRTVRISVRLDEQLVRMIDRAATSRSAFLAEAAAEKLQSQVHKSVAEVEILDHSMGRVSDR